MVLSAVRKGPVSIDLVQKSYEVAFNAATNKLRVKDENDATVRVIVVTEPTVLTFNIQESDPLVFNESPIEWVLGEFGHQLSSDSKTLTILVGQPASEIQPLVFNLVADLASPPVSGIRTSNLFLSTTEQVSSDVTGSLSYDPATGVFTFNSGWPLLPGQLLVFLSHPEAGAITVDISLAQPNPSSPIIFADPPIRWLRPEGDPPDWMQVQRLNEGLSLRLINHFFAGIGLAAPFRFIIEVNGVLLESPDPILVNTTIGDG